MKSDMMPLQNITEVLKGSSGSGDFGHVGRAGKRGGSGGGGGKGKPRKGRRSREALDKEIAAEKKSSLVDIEEKNIERLHANFDSHRSIIGKPNKDTIKRISKSGGIEDPFDVDLYIDDWNAGGVLDKHFTSQSVVRSLGAKYSPYEDSKRRSWESMLDSMGRSGNEDLKSTYDEITKAVYDETQKQFKEMGVTEVVLYRGMNNREATVSKGDTTTHIGNSLDSWTTDESVAKQFASADKHGFIMKTVIPTEKIFSMSSSGPGTSDQREMMVIGDGSADEVFIPWAN